MKCIASNAQKETTKTIHSSRGIILKENKILLTYSNHFKDYTSPGGQQEDNESLIETLKRELKEEIGVTILDYEELGYILEYYQNGDNFEVKKNYYYLIKSYRNGNHSRRTDEINYGMESRWVTLDEAILQNELQIKNRITQGLTHLNPFITTMEREISIYKYIKEFLL